jgi:hypothetical protein
VPLPDDAPTNNTARGSDTLDGGTEADTTTGAEADNDGAERDDEPVVAIGSSSTLTLRRKRVR